MITTFTKHSLVALIIVFSLASNISFAQEANLGDLSVRFCNDKSQPSGTSSLATTATWWVPEDICIYLSNGGTSAVNMKINFVDWTITNDSDQKKACQPESTKERFGKYISIPETEYRIEAGQSVEAHATATFPTTYAGMSYGCITYQATNDAEAGNGMFNVLTRKANFIDILVAGEIKLGFTIKEQTRGDNLGNSSQLIVLKDPTDGTYKGQISVSNWGNVAQEVTMDGSINARFKSTPLTQQTKKLLPGDTIDFIFPIQQDIPWYDGKVETKITLTNKPVFEFESPQITDEMRKSYTHELSSSIFIAPWKLLAGLIALLLIVFALSRSLIRRKKDKDMWPSTQRSNKPQMRQDQKMQEEQQEEQQQDDQQQM